jgi:hypothetical protein
MEPLLHTVPPAEATMPCGPISRGVASPTEGLWRSVAHSACSAPCVMNVPLVMSSTYLADVALMPTSDCHKSVCGQLACVCMLGCWRLAGMVGRTNEHHNHMQLRGVEMAGKPLCRYVTHPHAQRQCPAHGPGPS